MTGFISNKKGIFIFSKPSGRSMTAKLNEFTNELVFNFTINWTTMRKLKNTIEKFSSYSIFYIDSV